MDKTRASRDGHEFHEAWAARKALQLVMPSSDLVGIAVEGLSPADQGDASDETVEIADLTFYYGTVPVFDEASSVVIVQLKYSKSSETVPFRVSNAKKTVEKFAAAFNDFSERFGANETNEKLTFELVTNRPIASEFVEALAGLAAGAELTGGAREQAEQFRSACGFADFKLSEFATKVQVSGLAGSLRENKNKLSIVLADWSAASDTMARMRLGSLRALLRDKAGLEGEGQNVITRVSVLDALEVQSDDDLFPCPASFPDIGEVVPREQLGDVTNRIPALTRPLLVHAEGGSGKTAFLQSLSKSLSKSHKTVLFDCFGGGGYRAPEDGRHLPKRGLIHIVNLLACDGLCDPLLPNHENVNELMRAFRMRLEQAVDTMRRETPNKQIVLIIDAIDNAAEHAKDKQELSFPRLLLESIQFKGPIAGVQVVVSCRTYRREISVGDVQCDEVALTPFSLAEAQKYLRDRVRDVTDLQINVAYSRSEGNPRILEHLAQSDRGLLDVSEVDNVIELDALLMQRIEKSLADARIHGYKQQEINAFLAGLSVLPPPIPLEEYAQAHGMDYSAVQSFATDLAPLLERTKHGLMFRDEPTESFIRDTYAADTTTLRTLASNLLKYQDKSAYAATALPSLLQKLDDGKGLFDLALDSRMPAAITGAVGKRHIRYIRLKAAVHHATKSQDFDRLIPLMLELSSLAAVDQRGREYLQTFPDIVTAAKDIDAVRRLFEIHTHWAGTRHSRLAIADIFSGDLSSAYRHVVNVVEWTVHFHSQDEEYKRDRSGPDVLAAVAPVLYFLAQGQIDLAIEQLGYWSDWFVYGVAERLFILVCEAEKIGVIPPQNLQLLLESLSPELTAVSVAAICTLELDGSRRSKLIQIIADGLANKRVEQQKNYNGDREADFHDGLLKAVGFALSVGMHGQAATILSALRDDAPSAWELGHSPSNKENLAFLIQSALGAATANVELHAQMLLPKELTDFSGKIPAGLSGAAYRKALKTELEQHFGRKQTDGTFSSDSDTLSRVRRFVDDMLAPLHELGNGLASALSAPANCVGEPFTRLVEIWIRRGNTQGHFSEVVQRRQEFDVVGRNMILFLLATRGDLGKREVAHFLQKLNESGKPYASLLIDIVAILARRPDLHELAGETAVAAKALIEREDDVDYRASAFGDLARAIFPASSEEMVGYFRSGLDQLDAIGSGEYEFTNELLLFASELRGEELKELEFHTLSNICELNMSEADRFPWMSFANGLSRTSGGRSIARLARWHDRDRISLSYTLPPYLTALIEQEKMDPAIAISLLRLTDPVEQYGCGTGDLATVLAAKRQSDSKEVMEELVTQYLMNNPGEMAHTTLSALHKAASATIGVDVKLIDYLAAAIPKYKTLNEEGNDNRNYRGRTTESLTDHDERLAVDAANSEALAAIVSDLDPTNESAMLEALEQLDLIKLMTDKLRKFFDLARVKVKYGERSAYVRTVARLDSLDMYAKLYQLKICKEEWASSSAALQAVFLEIALPLIQENPEDFIHFDSLSSSKLMEVSQMTGAPIHNLILALVNVFASSDWNLPASIWIGLAAALCHRSSEGAGQAALARLLNSESAKLTATVTDGAWRSGLYPEAGDAELAAGLVWFSLGSHKADERWRAAHSIRCLARFGKWDVIDAVVARINDRTASPYQAPEITFYFLHAKLWLLIALARVAEDYPIPLSRYAGEFMAIVNDADFPHVLMRHFAAAAVRACVRADAIKLSRAEVGLLKKVNKSPWKIKRVQIFADETFYQGRPSSRPEVQPEFSLDREFDKNDISSVSDMFDRSRWDTHDELSMWVRKFDSNVTGMHVSGGHRRPETARFDGMKSRFHTYGQYLACHALLLVAGDYLAKYPVVRRPHGSEDEWAYWLDRELLTRSDGAWLSDLTTPPPLDAQFNLMEQGARLTELTSDPIKVLRLLKIESEIGDEVVVAGDWRSHDGVGIHIESALAPARFADKLAKKLAQQGGFEAWLPHIEIYSDGSESDGSKLPPYRAWIASVQGEANLDEADPFSTNLVVGKSQLSANSVATLGLDPTDALNRAWTNSTGNIAAVSETWGRRPKYEDDKPVAGERLICRTETLVNLLRKQEECLIILVRLRRVEKGYRSAGKYWHTTAVLRVDSTCGFEYYSGDSNKLDESLA